MGTHCRYGPKDYTVGWLCALPKTELLAARKMLDTPHEKPELNNPNDDNQYYFGDIHHHKVVIACMPIGMPGPVSAQRLVQPLRQSFPNMNLHLFVGVGGGIPRNPSPKNSCEDIHLGDVVIGWPEKTGARAIIQHDLIRSVGDDENPEQLTYFDKPDLRLINALTPIISERSMGQPTFERHLEKLSREFQHPGLETDRLFKAKSAHVGRGENACRDCTGLVDRPQREIKDPPQLHLGPILTGGNLVQSAGVRDKLSETYPDAICIEMEAAGVTDTTHCLVIRGISDYADSHRVSLNWHLYAAGTAAALAKEILNIIRPAISSDLAHCSHSSQKRMLTLSNSSDVRAIIDSNVQAGKSFYSQFQSHRVSQDLYSALDCFKLAHDILIKSDIRDPSCNARILFRLITIEGDLSHDHSINLDDRITHNREARDYAVEALSLANGEVETVQIRLEQAFIEGRTAELEKRRGTDIAETGRVMEKAKVDMNNYFAQLKALSPKKSKEYEKRVECWGEARLRPEVMA